MIKQKFIIVVLMVMWVVLGILSMSCKVTESNNNNNNENNDPPSTEDFYVSTKGSNNDDGSQGSPWRTIQYGLDNIKPGQTLHIAAGTYKESLYLDQEATSTKKIYIKGNSAADTILDNPGAGAERDLFFLENAQYIEISGLKIKNAQRAGMRLSYAHYITIHDCVFADNFRWGLFTDFSDYTKVENCEAYGSDDEHGIYISNSSDHIEIRNNRVHHNYACGIQINADPSMGGDGISSDCIIENNIVYANGKGGGAAINLASVRNSTIQNNMLYNNFAGGIAAWDDGQGIEWGCKGLTIIHNTVYFKPGEGRWALSLKNGCTNANIYNNILAGGHGGGFEFTNDSLSGIKIDYNVYYHSGSSVVVTEDEGEEYTLTQWQNENFDTHSRTATPQNLFVNPANTDFHLSNISPAVDICTNCFI